MGSLRDHRGPPILGAQRFYQPLDPVESFRKTAGLYFRCRWQGLTIWNTVDCLIGLSCQGNRSCITLASYTSSEVIMGTSVRLPARLERLVSRVAKERGTTKSEVICSALTVLEDESRTAHTCPTPYAAMKHLIGCASGGPSDLSVETGKKFRELLARRPIR